MFYELWDLESGNIVGDFDSEAEALQVVRELLEVNEPDFADALSLGQTGDDGVFALVAEGSTLAERAQAPFGQVRHSI
jgi:hypothetical protein